MEVPIREISDFSDTPFSDMEYEEVDTTQTTHFSNMSINDSLTSVSLDLEETLTDIEDDFLLDDVSSDLEDNADFTDEDEDSSSKPEDKEESRNENIAASRSPTKGVKKCSPGRQK
ncbi:uncharacterized protein LOC106661445 isoform X2 [Cimex lectularius]|uniref:Uncharacterized protein n=1 Tax=Cimex lectularius TaxID=79782 RepID=A0A8I6TKR1_CIMLE|nr:uncharacterized protein LOC106661445 isoform X2 [Cimex lectularius]